MKDWLRRVASEQNCNTAWINPIRIKLAKSLRNRTESWGLTVWIVSIEPMSCRVCFHEGLQSSSCTIWKLGTPLKVSHLNLLALNFWIKHLEMCGLITLIWCHCCMLALQPLRLISQERWSVRIWESLLTATTASNVITLMRFVMGLITTVLISGRRNLRQLQTWTNDHSSAQWNLLSSDYLA